MLESEPELEALADQLEPDAESVGPSLPELEVTEVESAAPADVAATHGPDADVFAADEGEPLVSAEAARAACRSACRDPGRADGEREQS